MHKKNAQTSKAGSLCKRKAIRNQMRNTQKSVLMATAGSGGA